MMMPRPSKLHQPKSKPKDCRYFGGYFASKFVAETKTAESWALVSTALTFSSHTCFTLFTIAFRRPLAWSLVTQTFPSAAILGQSLRGELDVPPLGGHPHLGLLQPSVEYVCRRGWAGFRF